jgi:AcrR family transcriptional regulator
VPERPSARDKILDALERILIDGGTGGVTLDAVAEAAQVSKGGLLYHFRSKAALFEGLTERLATEIDRAVADAPDDSDGLIRWYIETALPGSESETRLTRSLMASLRSDDQAGEPDTVPLHELFDRYALPLERLSDPVLALHVRLVGDGLFVNALVGLPPPGPDALEAIIQRLLAERRR